mmetsp:Transcript_30163/g.44576  ORF Transcript_30163/g.44576 Transcript_30163/m.44576 type:complete len:137 (-) Transcript_30163:118-528(-)
MAALLSDQGQARLEDAESLCWEARLLEGQREMLGSKHLDTLTSLNKMAALLSDEGKLEEAEQMYEEAAPEGRREMLENKYLDTLSSVSDMVALLSDLGKLEEAEPSYKEAQEGWRSLFGNQHPENLISILHSALFQ